jgi:hypothetical protein
MLLPEDIHPMNTLYFNGAVILQALLSLEEASMMELFMESRKTIAVSMSLFVLSLDWLFLSECITRNQEGRYVLWLFVKDSGSTRPLFA